MVNHLVTYPVILEPEASGYSVFVPDICGQNVSAASETDAITHARQLMAQQLLTRDTLPEATALKELQVLPDQRVLMVTVDLDKYRVMYG
ncbi:hypothetical protein [Levilactobacillus bambusae]|uniref:HicB family protein n=1 Tax=Levilactobacillus bambusae TaxID=2024736 RepID=A0A2V1MXI2_9LACO|nr:hypothetical protein [Levilactobacillus bambusae]PWF99763.1 hypothetical protein DCM90_06795 [Levilactobacillus bambusae]